MFGIHSWEITERISISLQASSTRIRLCLKYAQPLWNQTTPRGLKNGKCHSCRVSVKAVPAAARSALGGRFGNDSRKKGTHGGQGNVIYRWPSLSAPVRGHDSVWVTLRQHRRRNVPAARGGAGGNGGTGAPLFPVHKAVCSLDAPRGLGGRVWWWRRATEGWHEKKSLSQDNPTRPSSAGVRNKGRSEAHIQRPHSPFFFTLMHPLPPPPISGSFDNLTLSVRFKHSQSTNLSFWWDFLSLFVLFCCFCHAECVKCWQS